MDDDDAAADVDAASDKWVGSKLIRCILYIGRLLLYERLMVFCDYICILEQRGILWGNIITWNY